MFFRGIDSVPVRIAYLLTAISFVTTLIHFFVARRGVDSALLIYGGATFVFCLCVGALRKPRNDPQKLAIIVYSLVAWIIHALLSSTH
jgi:hypothetical protein